MKKNKYIRELFNLSIFLCVFLSFSQENDFSIPDSLKNITYEKLLEKFDNNTNNKELYAKVYLKKAKLKEDTIHMALGYKYMSKLYKSDYEKCIFYLDSAINISVNIKHKIYPALFYTNRGVRHSQHGRYKDALDSYLKAIKFSKEYGNEDLFYANIHNLAFLKSELGLHKEALKIYKKTFKYQKNKKVKDSSEYLLAHYVLANSYTFNKLYDSASIMNREGVKMAKKLNDIRYDCYILNEGINLYNQARYKTAIDSIFKAIPSFVDDFDKGLLIQSYLFLGKSYEAINDKRNTILYYKKIDSLFLETKYVLPQTREPYEYLISYYKRKNDRGLQLYYIENLLKVDSILDDNYQYLTLNITKKYDTPLLLSKKEKLIKNLLNDKKKSSKSLILVSVLLFFSGCLVFFYYRRQQLYKRRFNKLINSYDQAKAQNNEKKKEKIVNIDEQIIKRILDSLNNFEENKNFTERKISLSSLAKDFETNPKYLSLVVNVCKEKTFSNYLTDLRIEHAILRLKVDKTFRKYTIKAIALDVGFNNSQTFSNAFYKETGIYPSYFIKKLNEVKP